MAAASTWRQSIEDRLTELERRLMADEPLKHELDTSGLDGSPAPSGQTISEGMREMAPTPLLASLGRLTQDFARAGTPEEVQKIINGRLSHHGFNPEDVGTVGQFILGNAMQAGETPEDTVRGAFTIGIILGAMLGTNRQA